MSRIKLQVKAFLFRTLAYVFSLLDRYLSVPLPRRPSFSRTIPSSSSLAPGSIKLVFYTPKSYSLQQYKQPTVSKRVYPVLVNFHGGGFTIGRATDDARWATAVVEQDSPSQEAVVVSVAYRLAPEYPFPIAIEDCVAAIRWIWDHSTELNLDVSRTAISGFSAGGNLSLAVPIALNTELKKLKMKDAQHGQGVEHSESRNGGARDGQLVSIVSFYPSTNWTQTRAQRNASNPNLIPTIPPTLFRLFDESYLHPKPDMSNPLLSPGLASDEVLREALPENLVLITCAGDQLLAESEAFRERLKRLGKRVEGYTVQGVGHGWDKRPSFWKGDEKRDGAYRFAVEGLRRVWARED